jgi:hypothetical protein
VNENVECTLAKRSFALPGSNAPIERVFSIINALWSEEKTGLKQKN